MSSLLSMSTSSSAAAAAMNTPSSSSAPTTANTPLSSPPQTPPSIPVTELKANHTALGDALDKISERAQQKPNKDFPADADSIDLLRAPFDMMQVTMQDFYLKRTYKMCAIVNVEDGLRAFTAAEKSLRSFLSAPSNSREEFFQIIVKGLRECLEVILSCSTYEIEFTFATFLFWEMVLYVNTQDDPTYQVRLPSLLFNRPGATFAQKLHVLMVLRQFFGVAKDPGDIINWVYHIMLGEPNRGEDPCLLLLFKGEDAFASKFESLVASYRKVQNTKGVENQFWAWVCRIMEVYGEERYPAGKKGVHQYTVPVWPSGQVR